MSEEEKLRNLYKKMYLAMIQKDSNTLEEILNPDFVLVHMTGMRQSKDVFIKAVENGTLNYYTEATDAVDVTVNGDSAMVVGQSRVNAAVFGGGRYTWRLEQDLTCRRTKDGTWKIERSVASTY